MQKNEIIFLIRAYNESSRIVSVMESIFQKWYKNIVVIDDGSTDGLCDILKKNFWKKIFFLRHLINRGGGAAMETGLEFIRKNADEFGWKWVVTFDADGQMNIDDMKNFEKCIHDNVDAKVIFGSRFIKKTESNVPFFRKIILFGGRLFTKIISKISLTDAHNGYRMLHIDVVKKISLTLDGMEYASEMIEEIVILWEKIYEVPVNIFYDEYTLAKGQRFGGAFRIAIRMLFKKIF